MGAPGKRNEQVMTGACGVALGTLVPVALYQTGVIGHLPDPPSPVFDSDRITSSKIAHPNGIPDSLLGLASFGVTLGLILGAKRSSVCRKLLGAKLTLDASAAAFNLTRQVVDFQRLCSWCTGTAIAAGVTAYAGRHIIAGFWSAEAKSARDAIERFE